MSSLNRPWPAPALRSAARPPYLTTIFLAVVALLAQGCAQTPRPVFAGANAADAAVRVPPAHYSPAVSGYVSQRPVGPAPWIERNRQVTPAPGKEAQ